MQIIVMTVTASHEMAVMIVLVRMLFACHVLQRKRGYILAKIIRS